jgi:glyoxylase-like metal-dependent hydrolase (beta-lactamase superfamily II)
MGFYKTEQVAKDTWYIREMLGVGAYLFVGKDKALLSDTCNGLGDISKVVRKITGRPLIVMNTHGHADHVGGNSSFKDIFIHEGDRFMIDPAWQKWQRELMWSYVRERFPIARLAVNWIENRIAKRYATTYQNLNDGHEFDLGGRVLKSVHLPGHSEGCVMLLDKDTETIYAGDAINPGLFLFFKGCPSPKEYAGRLRALTGLEGYRWIATSHMKENLPISFIGTLADFLDRVSVEKSTQTDMPSNTGLPVLKYSEQVQGESYSEIHLLYSANA